MVEAISARIDMSYEEWRRVRPLMRRTGLFYQCDPAGIWVQLPRVATEGERRLHFSRLQPIVNALQEIRPAGLSRNFGKRLLKVS